MIETLQEFTQSLPEAVQWLGVILLGAIPFVESYFGSIIGIIAGVHPVVAIIAAIIGNVVSMLVFVLITSKIRARALQNREPQELTPRRQKLKQRFDRFGVPGVSLLGQFVLASQITAVAIISFGAPRNAVILWQTISIILWGVAYGLLAVLGLGFVFGF